MHFYNYQTADKPGASPDSMRNAYLYHLFCDSGILTLEGVDPKASAACDTDSKLSLGAVYTALMTHDTESGPEGFKATRTDEKRRRSALEVLNRHDHVVLLGDPGSGKTTFVNFVTCCMAGELLEKDDVCLDLLTRPLPDDEGEDEEERQKWDHGALLPIRVILRDFAARGMSEGEGKASDLWGFIEDELNGAEFGEFAPHMKKELMEKGGILLLDGLDEIPEADNRRVYLRETVEDFIRSFGRCRVLVTSRTYAYQKQDWRIPGLHEAVLAPFTSGQIRRFTDRWYVHVAGLRRKNQDEAQGNAELLKRAIFSSERLRELAQRPLLLTLMASLHSWRGGSLPENREELYADTVDLLLDWWERPKIVKDKAGKPVLAQPSLMEWLKTDRARMRRLLNELAYNAHSEQPDLTGTADIAEGDLLQGLWNLCKNPGGDMVSLMEFLRDRAGLLLPRGVKVYSFPHRTFQEYLAACHLTDCDYPDQVGELCRKEPDRWREVCLLAGAKAARGSSGSIWSLAEALCYREPESPDTDEADIWGALLAGQALAETAILDKISPWNQTKLDRVKKWLLRIIEGNLLPAVERVAAGNTLSRLGDPRFNPDMWYLPNDENTGFVTVPAGSFLMGSTPDEIKAFKSALPDGLDKDTTEFLNALFDSEIRHTVELSEYQIARYPVTIAQFRAFVDDSGYQPEGDWADDNEYANHPVVNVTWNDAVRYCEWLTEKLKDRGTVSLPTEAQWEKAARGTDGRIYPCGDKLVSGKANYKSDIGSTSPIGAFPEDISPYDCTDMTGNVSEWCSDAMRDYTEQTVTDPIGPVGEGSHRVVRGGSWDYPAWRCRAALRNWCTPGHRGSGLGFRLVLLPGQQVQASKMRSA